MNVVALFFLLFSSVVFGSPRLFILHPEQSPVELHELEGRFARAYALFEKEIGRVESPITLVVAGQNCLRTGYNFTTNQLNFCHSGKVRDMGLKSVDVFHHEVFHALLCNYRRELCGEDAKEDVHEGLADYFSYLLQPDDHFGEDYYLDQPFIREYHTTWRLGLVEKPHERGNVFASLFIQHKLPLKEALAYFEKDTSGPEVENLISGVPSSYLHRYRLSATDVMKIEFIFSVNVDRVEWEAPAGILIKRLGPASFEITIPESIKASKGLATFLASDGLVLGRRTYYFGSK